MGGRAAALAMCAVLLAGCAGPAGVGDGTPTVPTTAGARTSVADTGVTAAEDVQKPTVSKPVAPDTRSGAPSASEMPGQATDTPFTVRGVVLVNRLHPVTAAYVPAWANEPYGLKPAAYTALQKLLKDAKAAGMPMSIRSGYRSYAQQAESYAQALKDNDEATAKAYFAPAGASEHHTGLAADLWDEPGNHRYKQLMARPEMAWLAKHAADYGFIIRYPEGKQAITGYNWEPWHVRYVGNDLAKQIAAVPGLTLEEFLAA